MKFIVLALILIAAMPYSSFASSVLPCTDSSIQWIGRWPDRTVSGNATKTAINGGQRFRFKFSGTSLAINTVLPSLADGAAFSYPYIVYSIDGGAWTTALCNTVSVTLATGLSNSTHTFDCYVKGVNYNNSKWTNGSGFTLQEIVLDTGGALSPWPTGNTRKLLIIGDSIAEGQRALSGPDSIETQHMDGRQSFANILGGMLGYDTWVHAFGGSGFYGYFLSNIPPTQDNYPYKMNGIAKTDPVFDAIIVESVNNDGNSRGETSAQFQSRLTGLINQLKVDQPTAKIFVTDPLPQWVPERVADVKAVCSATGAINIDYTGLTPTGGSWGANLNHPDVAHAQQIATFIYNQQASNFPATVSTVAAASTATMRASFR